MVAKSGPGRPDLALLTAPAEQDLLAALQRHEEEVASALGRGDVQAGLRALAGLAAPLDRFFTDVLVLVDDEGLRNARLGLLARVEKLFLTLADVSKLST
jgi:glycyl-tRNA synthetase beta chain